MKRLCLLAGFFSAGLAGAAHAGLEICNDTGTLQSIALGYKGDTDWTSEGWWNIEPGNCALVVGGDLTKRYYYYHADSALDTFRGQDFGFCTDRGEFTIVGDVKCEDRGYALDNFREIDTGETAKEFKLTLVESDGPGERETGSGSKAPLGNGDDTIITQTVSEQPEPTDVTINVAALQTDLPAGRHGDAFETLALFQGCELEDGRASCAFHANGMKMRTFYNGPTPNDLLYALEEMPINMAVMLAGDRADRRNLHEAVVIRNVEPRPGSDKLANLRATLQGDWIAQNDRRSEITIRGSEIYVRYDGTFKTARFMQLQQGCTGMQGNGPALIQTSLRDKRPKCYGVVRADGGALELAPVEGGNRLLFRRAN